MSSAPTSDTPRRVTNLFGRVLLLCAGSLLSTFCYAVTIRADIGLGPLFVLQDGIAKQAGIDIGVSVIITGFGLVFVAAALRSWPGPGTLALPVMGGVALDLLLPHLPDLHGWAFRLFAVVVATWFMALAGALMIRASVGVSAYDAVMLGLKRITKYQLGPIRLAMEATVLAVGWMLGGAVGVGTVITGLLIGPGLQFWVRVVGPRTAVPAPALEAVIELEADVVAPLERRGLRVWRPAFMRDPGSAEVTEAFE